MRFTAALMCAPLLLNLASGQSAAVDEVGIYRAVLRDSDCSGLGRIAGRHVLVVHRATLSLADAWWLPASTEESDTVIAKWFPQAGSGVAKEFLKANRHETELPGAIFTDPGVTAIDARALQAIEDTGNFWDAFYRRHPAATGVIRLGAVAVQPDSSHVLAYCGRQSAPLGGEGHLFLLSRSSSGWRVAAKRLLWES